MDNRTPSSNAKKYAILQDAAYRKNIREDQGFAYCYRELSRRF